MTLTIQETDRLPETRQRIAALKRLTTGQLRSMVKTPENFKNKSSRDAICILIRSKEGRLFEIDRVVAGESLDG